MDLLRNLSIRIQLLLLALIVAAAMISIMFLNDVRISETIRKKYDDSVNRTFMQMNDSISENCDVLNRIASGTAQNIITQQFLLEEDPTRKYELGKGIDSLFTNMGGLKDGILDIVAFSDVNTYGHTVQGIEQLRHLARVIPHSPHPYYSEALKMEYGGREYNCFLIVMPVYSTQNLSKGKIGYIGVVVDGRSVVGAKWKKEDTDNRQLYLLDRENRVFLSNRPPHRWLADSILEELVKSVGTTFNAAVDLESYIVSTNELPFIQGKVISLVSENELLSELNKLRTSVISIFLAVGLLLLLCFSLISRNILQPLNKFIRYILQIKSGDLKSLKQRIVLYGYKEISIMSQEFNHMLDEIDHLTHRLLDSSTKLYLLELEKKQSELAFLQSQINPHFLYNTLESIKCVAAVREVDEIKEMAQALAQIFRYSIKGEDRANLGQEMEIVRAYLSIQQIRFGDRFTVMYSIAPETYAVRIPKMILQPIVENAIFHGLEPKVGNGHLEILCRLEAGQLLIRIRDDGVGMTAEALETLQRGLEAGIDAWEYGKSGIGLFNVNNRIRLVYGIPYGLAIDGRVGGGTEVTVILPVERANHVQGDYCR